MYQLSAFIAVKRARTGEDEQADHANEQRMFQLLENYSPIPYLIRCYYQRPKDTFLEFAPNRCVATLLNQYQKRGDDTRVREISQILDSQIIHRWMRQLCLAAAGLERIGLVHGDIRSGNMLLDANWNLILSDLDRGMKVGDNIAVLTEPFGRLLGKQDGGGTYGKAGARTETFAIGSVYYTLLRGHEPYETEDWGRDRFVTLCEKFQNKEFPPLTGAAEDAIIHKCWSEGYQQVKELLVEFTGDAEQDESEYESADKDLKWLETRQVECKEFIQSGLVDTLDRY